jgi:hypothetical protein
VLVAFNCPRSNASLGYPEEDELEDKVESAQKIYERVSATEASENRIYALLEKAATVLDEVDQKMEEAHAFATSGELHLLRVFPFVAHPLC